MANGIRTGDTRGFNKGRSSVKVPDFDKHLNIGRNVVEITTKMKAIVRKPYFASLFFPYIYIYIAQSSGAVEYNDSTSVEGLNYPPQPVSWIWHKTIWWWGSSNAGNLGNAEYPFISIATRSTLAQIGSTW